jgi:hypothetical protein
VPVLTAVIVEVPLLSLVRVIVYEWPPSTIATRPL